MSMYTCRYAYCARALVNPPRQLAAGCNPRALPLAEAGVKRRRAQHHRYMRTRIHIYMHMYMLA